MKKLNWEKLWDELYEWHAAAEVSSRCPSCGHNDYAEVNPEEQQEKIEQLVEKARRKAKG